MSPKRSDFCEFCDGALRQRVVRAQFPYMGQTIYIDHVPARVCDRCGEQYYEGRVYERMAEIAKDPSRFVGEVRFPLAEYAPGTTSRAETADEGEGLRDTLKQV